MKYLLLLFLTILAVQAKCQTLERIAIEQSNSGSAPTCYTIFKNKLYVSADEGFTGREIWVVDSNVNPNIVTDLFPSIEDGFLDVSSQKMAKIGDTLYFSGSDGHAGYELWGYNGYGQPFIVKDIAIGIDGSYPSGLTALNGKLYFSANSSGSGSELWCYDPTTMLAKQVRDIEAGSGSSNPMLFNVVNDKIVFVAETNTSGIELYAYDPRIDSLEFFDIDPGISNSCPMNFTNVDNKLYFSATTLAVGGELFCYDGIVAPNCVKNIVPFNGSAFEYVISRGMTYLNNKLFFSGTWGGHYDWPQLMVYDLITGNVTLDTLCNGHDAEIRGFIVYHNKVYFGAKDNTGTRYLWCSDGINKAIKIADVDLTMYRGNENMMVFKDWLYFTASERFKGTELYKFHDTEINTGVQLVNFEADIILFPNPSTDLITLSINLKKDQELSIAIYSTEGKLLLSEVAHTYAAGKNERRIDISRFQPGQYFYKIVCESGKNGFSGSFLKQ